MKSRNLMPAGRAISGVATSIGFLMALSGVPAQAQQSELDELRQQLAKLQARIDQLEEKQKKAPPAPTIATASKTNVVISGLLQEQFNGFLGQQNPAGTRKSSDTFNLRRAEIKIAAPHITDRIAGSVMFDLGKVGNVDGTTGRAGSVLQELQLTYALNQNPKAPLLLDIGQYKPGIGYESDLVSSSALLLSERALMYRFTDIASGTSTTNRLNRGGLGDRRDQGARLRGSFENGRWNYNVGVFNGLGDTQNTQAQGDPKAEAARLYYRPGVNSGWMFGASYADGDTRNDIPLSGLTTESRVNRNFYGAFAVYKKNKLTFQSEYANLESSDYDGPLKRNARGYYGALGYIIHPKWELVARYDRLSEETTSAAGVDANGVAKETSLGVNYYIKGNNAKIQADIVKVDGDGLGSNSTVAQPFDSYQLRTQFQVTF